MHGALQNCRNYAAASQFSTLVVALNHHVSATWKEGGYQLRGVSTARDSFILLGSAVVSPLFWSRRMDMIARRFVFAAGLLVAVPAFAQAPAPNAAQNAAIWNFFQKLYPPRAIAALDVLCVVFGLSF